MLQHNSGIKDLNVITVYKEQTGEKYVFIYEPCKAMALVWLFMRLALNSELSFNWSDASHATNMVRKLLRENSGRFDVDTESV